MKHTALLALMVLSLVASSRDPGEISQTVLEDYLERARIAWGQDTEVRSISMEDFGGCERTADGGHADLVNRTIQLNKDCHWTKTILQTAVLHEYGHLLLGSGAHSLDPHSVMFKNLQRRGQKITAEDREWLSWSGQRPSILIENQKRMGVNVHPCHWIVADARGRIELLRLWHHSRKPDGHARPETSPPSRRILEKRR